MLKTKIGHVTMIDSEESTTIIGITHGLAWKNLFSSLSVYNYCITKSVDDTYLMFVVPYTVV